MVMSTETTIIPCVGGGQNFEMYWVSGSNISPLTRAQFIQSWKPNEFRITSIHKKNCTKGLMDKKSFPWKNSRARPLLLFGLPGLGHTWKTMEWTPYSVSMIQI